MYISKTIFNALVKCKRIGCGIRNLLRMNEMLMNLMQNQKGQGGWKFMKELFAKSIYCQRIEMNLTHSQKLDWR